jgi:hypothetical protein
MPDEPTEEELAGSLTAAQEALEAATGHPSEPR